MGNSPYELVKASKFPKNYCHSCKTRGTKTQNKESEKVRLNFSKKNHFSKNF